LDEAPRPAVFTTPGEASLAHRLKAIARGCSYIGTKEHSGRTCTTKGSTMARRSHPYFGRLNRREILRKLEPGQRTACEPLVKPREEPGILWDAFREEH
jgi:hypothetical protein